jgi:hypothetical protein
MTTTTTLRPSTVEAVAANVSWIEDPGHGWLLVNLHAYPDALDYADEFCYRSGDVVALEEDCAAGAFLLANPGVAVMSMSGRLTTRVCPGDAPVRSWPRCNPRRA